MRLALAVLAILAPLALPAATWTLQPGGGDLQRVVEGARPGDRIVLQPGTYHLEPVPFTDPTCGNCPAPATPVPATRGLLVDRPLRIVGAGEGPEDTVLWTRSGYGLLLDGCRQAVLENLTVRGGARDPDGRATDGGVVVRRCRARLRGVRIILNQGDPAVVDEVVVGIAGVVGRESSRVILENCEISGNSWDGVALYRGSRAVISGTRIDGGEPFPEWERWLGGRGVAVGATWNARASVRDSVLARYWKGAGAFVDARLRLRGTVIEDVVTWGVALWPGTEDGHHPWLGARGNVIHGTGACGASAPAADAAGRDLGFFSGNALLDTGRDPRYDDPERYCRQRALDLWGTREGRPFVARGNLYRDNREPDAPPREEAGLEEIRRLCGAGGGIRTRFHDRFCRPEGAED